jgi:hypothetical protein
MLARFRDRLSYANVVATLALFVALGGTGYAASQLTGRDIKNRSLSRVDIKKNALTGTEIKEGTLKQVPRALQATNAINANSALAADVAKNSDSATVAGIASDARALAGQGAASFEKSSRVSFGRAAANPAGTPNEQVLLSWPEMGVQVTTSTNQCGGGGGTSFAVKSTKGAGGSTIEFNDAGNSVAGGVSPGATARRCSSNGQDSVDAEISDAERSLFVDCIRAASQLRCLGVRSEP